MLKLEDNVPKVKLSLFKKPVILEEVNKGTIALAVSL